MIINACTFLPNDVFSYSAEDGVSANKSGDLHDDWDGDGKQDSLSVKTTEEEGSSFIKSLKLNLSSSNQDYTMNDTGYVFINILACDLDQDEDSEILLVFDTRYAGANGACALVIFDQVDGTYTPITKDPFTGDLPDTEKNIAGMYSVELLEDSKGKNSLRVRQYVAGKFQTDHIGDIVSTYVIEDGKLMANSTQYISCK